MTARLLMVLVLWLAMLFVACEAWSEQRRRRMQKNVDTGAQVATKAIQDTTYGYSWMDLVESLGIIGGSVLICSGVQRKVRGPAKPASKEEMDRLRSLVREREKD